VVKVGIRGRKTPPAHLISIQDPSESD